MSVNTLSRAVAGKPNLPLLNMNGEKMKNGKIKLFFPDSDLQSSMLLLEQFRGAVYVS